MNLAASNIAWDRSQDEEMYAYLHKADFRGLEVAPTRIFADRPYERIAEIRDFSRQLRKRYDLRICSLQSIWYGRAEKLFGEHAERAILLEYTKKAIDFANAAGCGNLVFGCPKNRVIQDSSQYESAVAFFRELGSYAHSKKTVLSIEANPPLYQTNFINTTREAFQLCKDVDCEGFAVNLDLGTVLENDESLSEIMDFVQWIHHIHLSEPNLSKLEKRALHREFAKMLKDAAYQNFISIEMKKYDSITIIKDSVCYIGELYG